MVVAQHKPEQQVHARHILVDTKEQAEKIIEELKGGAKFEDLAKQSKDPSGQNGGDLGFFGPGRWCRHSRLPPSRWSPGKVTEQPVQTEYGFHVIKVEEKRMSAAADLRRGEGPAPQLRPPAEVRAGHGRVAGEVPGGDPRPDSDAAGGTGRSHRRRVCARTGRIGPSRRRCSSRGPACYGPRPVERAFSVAAHGGPCLAVRAGLLSGASGGGWGSSCDRRSGHPLRGAHRSAAGEVRSGGSRRWRLHKIALCLSAGRVVSCKATGREGEGARGQFR